VDLDGLDQGQSPEAGRRSLAVDEKVADHGPPVEHPLAVAS
jgi:hypothetical protein